MRKRRVKMLRRAVLVLCAPVFLGRFFAKETGSGYGVGFFRKARLLLTMYRNRFRIVTASGLLDQVVMVTEMLRIPRSVDGVVVECGSYQGGSTTNFSLVCALMGRTLHVFDSFAGLPEPSKIDKLHTLPSVQELRAFEKGDFYGTLETVKTNVQHFGNLEVCRFHVGYFDSTLPGFVEPCVFAFCDVDTLCRTHLALARGPLLSVHTRGQSHGNRRSVFRCSLVERATAVCPSRISWSWERLGLVCLRSGIFPQQYWLCREEYYTCRFCSVWLRQPSPLTEEDRRS